MVNREQQSQPTENIHQDQTPSNGKGLPDLGDHQQDGSIVEPEITAESLITEEDKEVVQMIKNAIGNVMDNHVLTTGLTPKNKRFKRKARGRKN